MAQHKKIVIDDLSKIADMLIASGVDRKMGETLFKRLNLKDPTTATKVKTLINHLILNSDGFDNDDQKTLGYATMLTVGGKNYLIYSKKHSEASFYDTSQGASGGFSRELARIFDSMGGEKKYIISRISTLQHNIEYYNNKIKSSSPNPAITEWSTIVEEYQQEILKLKQKLGEIEQKQQFSDIPSEIVKLAESLTTIEGGHRLIINMMKKLNIIRTVRVVSKGDQIIIDDDTSESEKDVA